MPLNASRRFLDNRPTYQPPVEFLLVDEYELRLDTIARIKNLARSHDPKFRINAAIFTLFMVMPLQQV